MNPDQPPLDQHFSLPGIRRVNPDRPFFWLRAAWQDLRANPIASLAYGLLFAIAGDVILILVWHNAHLFFAAISGFFLISPLLCAGLYEISRRRESGLSSTHLQSLAGWSRNGESIAMFGLFLAFVGFVWERLSAVLFTLLAPDLATELGSFISGIAHSSEHLTLAIVWLLAGGCLALFVFAISAVSIPMLLDRDADFVTAMMTSVRAVIRNPLTLLVWGVLIVLIALLGFATLLFGLIVLIPLIGHATWHAYRELVE